MSKNTSCNECQNVIKKEGDFINKDDKTLYGYPRYYQTNLDDKTTTFSYDSDEDEYDLCYNCKLDTWFENNFGDSFKIGDIPICNYILEEAKKTFNLNFTNENQTRIKNYIINIYEKYLEDDKQLII